MKKTKKIGLVSAFCTAMLSLTACTQPSNVSDPPSAESSAAGSEYDLSSAEEVQDVYGPPVADDSAPADESSSDAVPPEESSFDPANNIPSVVYGPPDTDEPANIPEDSDFQPAENIPHLVYGPPPASESNAPGTVPE